MKDERRALAILEHDPELKRFDKELDNAVKAFKEKKMFIEKQLEEAHKSTVQIVWRDIGDYLVSKGILETYNPEKDSLLIRDGVVFHKKVGEGVNPDNHTNRTFPVILQDLFRFDP